MIYGTNTRNGYPRGTTDRQQKVEIRSLLVCGALTEFIDVFEGMTVEQIVNKLALKYGYIVLDGKYIIGGIEVNKKSIPTTLDMIEVEFAWLITP